MLDLNYYRTLTWIWDGESGDQKYGLQPIDMVKSVAFSPSENLIATASDDHTLRIWYSDTGKLHKMCGKVYDDDSIEYG